MSVYCDAARLISGDTALALRSPTQHHRRRPPELRHQIGVVQLIVVDVHLLLAAVGADSFDWVEVEVVQRLVGHWRPSHGRSQWLRQHVWRMILVRWIVEWRQVVAGVAEVKK